MYIYIYIYIERERESAATIHMQQGPSTHYQVCGSSTLKNSSDLGAVPQKEQSIT